MRKSEWSDKQLEELLRQMPKLRDARQPHEIYQSLSFKMNRSNYKSRVLPVVASAAALLLLFMLIPGVLTNEKEPMSNANRSAPIAEKKQAQMDVYQVKNKKENANEPNGLLTAAYENNIGNGKVLTYWIPDRQAQLLIPVSAVIHRPGKKTWVELFTAKMARLQEKQWGLSEYYPVQASLKLDEQSESVVVDLPDNQRYGQGSAAEINFIWAMENNISSNSNFKKMKLSTNGNPGIELGNAGKKSELDIRLERNRAYFFYTPAGKKVPFLVPSLQEFSDIKSALEAMRTDFPDLGLKASLPSSFEVNSVAVKNKTLYLSLGKNHRLTNNEAMVHTYEAILLTAKDFGFENVKFKNPNIKNLGPFDLSKETKVPVAANLRLIENQP